MPLEDDQPSKWSKVKDFLSLVPWFAIVSVFLLGGGLALYSIKGKAMYDKNETLLAEAGSSTTEGFPRYMDILSNAWIATVVVSAVCIAAVVLLAALRLDQNLRKLGRRNRSGWPKSFHAFIHYISGFLVAFSFLCCIWFVFNGLMIAVWGANTKSVYNGTTVAAANYDAIHATQKKFDTAISSLAATLDRFDVPYTLPIAPIQVALAPAPAPALPVDSSQPVVDPVVEETDTPVVESQGTTEKEPSKKADSKNNDNKESERKGSDGAAAKKPAATTTTREERKTQEVFGPEGPTATVESVAVVASEEVPAPFKPVPVVEPVPVAEKAAVEPIATKPVKDEEPLQVSQPAIAGADAVIATAPTAEVFVSGNTVNLVSLQSLAPLKPLNRLGAVLDAENDICFSQGCLNLNYYSMLKSNKCLCSKESIESLGATADALVDDATWTLIGIGCLLAGSLVAAMKLSADHVMFTADQKWLRALRKRSSKSGGSPTREKAAYLTASVPVSGSFSMPGSNSKKYGLPPVAPQQQYAPPPNSDRSYYSRGSSRPGLPI